MSTPFFFFGFFLKWKPKNSVEFLASNEACNKAYIFDISCYLHIICVLKFILRNFYFDLANSVQFSSLSSEDRVE